MSAPSLTRFKLCTRCGCTKPATTNFFNRRECERKGPTATCKACKRLTTKAWYAANRERALAYHAGYRSTNAAKVAAVKGACKAASPERYREIEARYRENNREAINERHRRWYEANKEKSRRWVRNYQARKAGAGGTHTADEVAQMIVDQDWRCAYCEGLLDEGFHVDHMTPLGRGGRNDWTNLAVVCSGCNLRKGAKTTEELVA